MTEVSKNVFFLQSFHFQYDLNVKLSEEKVCERCVCVSALKIDDVGEMQIHF